MVHFLNIFYHIFHLRVSYMHLIHSDQVHLHCLPSKSSHTQPAILLWTSCNLSLFKSPLSLLSAAYACISMGIFTWARLTSQCGTLLYRNSLPVLRTAPLRKADSLPQKPSLASSSVRAGTLTPEIFYILKT